MQTFNERVLKCLLRHLKYKIGVFISKKILKGVKNDFEWKMNYTNKKIPTWTVGLDI